MHYLLLVLERVIGKGLDFSNIGINKKRYALDLPTLAYRRKRGDMIMVFKIMKGIVDLN